MAAYNFYVTQSDLLPIISGTLRDAAGVAVTFSSAPSAAVFNMRHKESNAPVVVSQAVTFTYTTGAWSYTWQAGNTDTTGLHLAEVELTIGGKKLTFPSFEKITVFIAPQMG